MKWWKNPFMMNQNFEEEAIVIRDLANHVVQKCAPENIRAPLNLCVFLVDLKLLQLSKSVTKVRSDKILAETVVEECVKDLRGNGLRVETLNLQIFWREKYQCRDEIKRIHHETVFKNVLPLMTEIAEGNLIKTVDKENLYKKIVVFIVMFAGLGDPTQQSIIKETQVALASIFKTTEIDSFLNLSKTSKEQQLIEFARLITGIRLFNKDCKKGGEGIDDLPLILTEGIQATKERLATFKDQLDKRIEDLVKTLSQIWNLKDPREVVSTLPLEFEPEEVEDIKNKLVYCKQLELCLKDLVRDLNESSVYIGELVERLQSTLLQVHDVVKYRVAIATVQVFPLFLQLSNVWVEMQEEIDVLSEINNNLSDLISFGKIPQQGSLELSLCKKSDVIVSTDSTDICDLSSEFYPGVKICNFASVTDQELQYEGFCAWTVALTEGILIPGNSSIGVLHFGNRLYSFSSADAAHRWAKDPKFYIVKILKMVRAKPELIRLLNLYKELEASILEDELASQRNKSPTRESVEVQTVLHPIESCISREYTFSEWEMKKRAIKIASLTRCITRSQQTIERSLFRSDQEVQVTPSKTKQTQTTRDGSCNQSNRPFAFRIRSSIVKDGAWQCD